MLLKSKQILVGVNMSCCIFAFMPTSHANTPITHLEPVVISATKTLKRQSTTPVPVIVLTEQDLKNNHARTLKQALELLPNVALRPIHGKNGYEVIMQGFDGKHVLILIDGLPVNPASSSTVNISQYLNTEVQQIEVIQGAASAQYGSAAMGGVINVITKPLQSQQKLSGNARVEVASNGEQNVSGKNFDNNSSLMEANVNIPLDKQGKWLSRLSLAQQDDKGLTRNAKTWGRLQDGSHQKQFTAKLLYQPNSNDFNRKIWLEASKYQGKDVGRFFDTINKKPNQKVEDIDKKRILLGFDYQFDEHNVPNILKNSSLTGRLLNEKYNSHSVTHEYSLVNSAYTKELAIDRKDMMDIKLAQIQWDLPIWQGDRHQHAIQLGAKWQQDHLTQVKDQISELSKSEPKRHVKELYVQDDWQLGDRWEIVSGLRYQHDSDFGSHLAPKVAIKFHPTDKSGREHIFRASIGHGYRVPDLKQRYFSFDHSFYGYRIFGNPNLKPEASNSYQLGYQSQFTKNINLAINLFYNDAKNFIITKCISDYCRADPSNPMIRQYQNIQSNKSYGGDIGINWQIDDKNRLSTGYTHTHTLNKINNKPLQHHPKHKVNLALTQQVTPKLQLINRINYEGSYYIGTDKKGKDYYTPSWWHWDSKINYQMNQNLGVYAGINNVLNHKPDVANTNDQSPVNNRQILMGATVNF